MPRRQHKPLMQQSIIQAALVRGLYAALMVSACGDTTDSDDTRERDVRQTPRSDATDEPDISAPDDEVETETDVEVYEEFNPPLPECLDNAAFFQDVLWPQVVEPVCLECHVSGGIAASGAFLLDPPGQPGYLWQNQMVLEAVTTVTADGKSILERKPVGELSHGGGEVISADGYEVELIREFVARTASPEACDTPSYPKAETVLEIEPLSATLRKVTILFEQRLPTAQEFERLGAGDEESLRAMCSEIVSPEAAANLLGEAYERAMNTQILEISNAAFDLVDFAPWPNFHFATTLAPDVRTFVADALNRAIASQAKEIVFWVVANQRPFNEILTNPSLFANDFLAFALSLPNRSGEVALDDPFSEGSAVFWGIEQTVAPMSGVLTTFSFISRYKSNATNRNRDRSQQFQRLFLNVNFAPLEGDLWHGDYEDGLTSRADEDCEKCHQQIDSIAGLFMNWSETGTYLPAPTWYGEMVQPGLGETRLPASQAPHAVEFLGTTAAQDVRFSRAVVATLANNLFEWPIVPPIDPMDVSNIETWNQRVALFVQASFIEKEAAAFRASNYDATALVNSMIMSPFFRSTQPKATYSDIGQYLVGDGRALSARHLDRKIQAILGTRVTDPRTRELKFNGQWLADFDGADDSKSARRHYFDDPLRWAMIETVASQTACVAVPLDFARAPADRYLFGEAESLAVADPTNPTAAERAQVSQIIDRLVRRFLGDQRQDPELSSGLVTLFFLSLKNGRAAIVSNPLNSELGNCGVEAGDDSGGEEGSGSGARELLQDPDFLVRAWMPVVAILLTDYRFLTEF
jgi:hypothetical protein